MHDQNRNGFTLVELAIALVVIGLLIGGILKGRELADNSRISSLIRHLKEYDSAAMVFRNTYGALPGDIQNPGSRLTNCNTSVCNVSGDDDGRVFAVTGYLYENANFFPHLTKAGLVSRGPEGGTAAQFGTNKELFIPALPLQKVVYGGVSWEANVRGHYHELHRVPGKAAFAIDKKLDNGLVDGKVYIAYDEVENCGLAGAGPEYNTKNGVCFMIIPADF